MDMSKSSEYRIKEAVNLMKAVDIGALNGLQKEALRTKIRNPYMIMSQEGALVPHILTHQEYVYMMEHLQELMNGESSPVPAPVPGPDSGR